MDSSSSSQSATVTTNIMDFGDVTIAEHLAPALDTSSRTANFADVFPPELSSLVGNTATQFSDYLRKPFQIAAFNWNVGVINGQQFANIRVPYDCLQTSDTAIKTPLALLLDRFKNVRYQLHFYLMIASMRFYQGQLILSWVPGLGTPANLNFNQYTAINSSHVVLNARENRSALLATHWVSPSSHIDSVSSGVSTASSDFRNLLGSVRVTSFNGLNTGSSNAQSIPVKLFAYISKVEQMNPIMPQTTFLNAVPHGIFDFILDLPGKIVDTVESTVAAGEALFSGDLSEAASKFGDAVSSGIEVAEGAGEIAAMLDKPRLIEAERATMDILCSPAALMKGPDNTTRLGVAPAGIHLPNKVYHGSAKPQLNIIRIAQTPSLLYQGSISTTTAADTRIFSTYINPMMSPVVSQQAGPTVTNVVYPTFLHHATKLTSRWRGSIELTIELVATQLHNMVLTWFFIPGADPNLDVGINTYSPLNAASSGYVHSGQIRLGDDASTATKILLNYAIPPPMLAVHGPALDAVDGLFHDEPNWFLFNAPEPAFSGFFALVVRSPLIAPATVFNVIEYNIYINAGPDYVCAIPYAIDSRPPLYSTTTNPDSTAVTPQSDGGTSTLAVLNAIPHAGDETETVEHIENVPVVETSGLKPSIVVTDTGMYFRDIVSDVRDFCRRKVVMSRFNLPLTPTNNTFDYFQFPVFPGDANFGYFTPAEHFSRIFSHWSGTIRYTFVFGSSKNFSSSGYVYHDIASNSFSANYATAFVYTGTSIGDSYFACQQFNTCTAQSVSIDVPFYSVYPILSNQMSRADRANYQGGPPPPIEDTRYAISQNGVVTMRFDNNDPAFNNIPITVWCGMGDDFTMYNLIYPPPVAYDPNVGALSPFFPTSGSF